MYCLPLLKRAAARVWPVLALLVFSLTMAQAADAPKKAVRAAQVTGYTNHLGMTFVDIPAGSFVMGSCKQDKKAAFLGEDGGCLGGVPDADASDDETPQHRVSIRSFQMGRTEVTLGQFKRFIKATGNSQLVDDDFIKYNAYGDDAPVVQVSWHDAQAFIDWLNQSKPAGDGGVYRLPSEAEWEYVARSAQGIRSWSDIAWYDGNAGGHQHPVASKQPNNMGVYDMNGNVYEWVQDCWHDSYRGAPSDGSAWTSSCKSGGRGLRGGSWNYSAGNLRAAYRGSVSPGDRNNYVGFRLARTR